MQFCPERRLRRCENKCGEKCIHPETKQWTCNQVFYHRLDPAARLDAYLAVQPLLASRGRQKRGIHMFSFSTVCIIFCVVFHFDYGMFSLFRILHLLILFVSYFTFLVVSTCSFSVFGMSSSSSSYPSRFVFSLPF